MEKVHTDTLISDDFGRPLDPNNHRDAITGAPHSHPVGTGVGAAVGGTAAAIVAAAAIGAGLSGPAAPIGGVVGAVVGALIGGAAGHSVSTHYENEDQDLYWRENYRTRPYYSPDVDYVEYGPAYQYGWESGASYTGQNFSEVEPALAADWDRYKGSSTLTWEKAKAAARDAWERTKSHGRQENAPAANTEAAIMSEVLTTDDEVSTTNDVVATPEADIRTPASEVQSGRDVGRLDTKWADPDAMNTEAARVDRMTKNPDDGVGRPTRQPLIDPAD